jgi:hypothetical protein
MFMIGKVKKMITTNSSRYPLGYICQIKIILKCL